MDVHEVVATLDRAIVRERRHILNGEGDQALLDDLLERRADPAGLVAFIAIVHPEAWAAIGGTRARR
jgi:hypothetical protein